MKRSISLLLVISLFLSAFLCPWESSAVYAEGTESEINWKLPVLEVPEDKVRVVSIGDSTSNGYYNAGFNRDTMGEGSNAADHCYPMEIYNELVNIYGEESVIYSQYCINTTRWNELAYYLECYCGFSENYADKAVLDSKLWTEEDFEYSVSIGATMLGDPDVYMAAEEGKRFAAAFSDSIENADFITIDLGMNAFGTYVFLRMIDELYGYEECMKYKDSLLYSDTLLMVRDEIIERFPNEAGHDTEPNLTLAALRELEASVLEGFSEEFSNLAQGYGYDSLNAMFLALDQMELSAEQAYFDEINAALAAADESGLAWILFDLIEGFTYALAGNILNYDKSLSYIYELNPDVGIIVDGLSNVMNGTSVTLGDFTLDLEELFGIYISASNDFFAGESEIAVNRYTDKIRFNSELPMDLPLWIDKIGAYTEADTPLTNFDNCDQETLALMVDIFYGLLAATIDADEEEMEANAQEMGNSLLEGIREEIYAEVLVDEDVKQYVSSQSQRESLANTAAEKAVNGIKQYCMKENGNYLTPSDIMNAYDNNSLTDVDLGLSTWDYIAIAFGSTDRMVQNFGSQKNAYFFVASAFEAIRFNMQAAANYRTIDLEAVITAFKSEDMSDVNTAFTDFYGDETTNGARSMAHLAIRAALSAAGTHPSPEGMNIKCSGMRAIFPKPDLKIEYLKTDGSIASSPYYVMSFEHGTEFAVASPEITGYIADHETISGTFDKDPQEFTVVYYSTSTEMPAYLTKRINQIGEVTYTKECLDKILSCTEIYNSLTSTQKNNVSNYSVLTAAEAAFAEFESRDTAFEVVITSRKDGGSKSVVNVSGGGMYYPVRGGDISAPEEENGLVFKGWYVWDEEASETEIYSEENNVHVSPEKNLLLIAVYEAKEDTEFTLTADFDEYEIFRDGEGVSYQEKQSFACEPGTEIKVTNKEEGTEILFWKDGNRNTLSKSDTVALVLTRDIALTGVTIPAGERANYAYVYFLGESGNIVAEGLYSTSDTITFPSGPASSSRNKTFSNWDMDQAAITAAMAEADEIKVNAVYKTSGRY